MKYQTSRWGHVQSQTEILPGIDWVTTPGHGGAILTEERNNQVPEYMRTKDRHYEEDCEWSVIFVVFAEEITKNAPKLADQIPIAKTTLANWYPEKYEKFFNATLSGDESHTRAEELFYQENKGKLMVITAYGSWHEKVPKDKVGCVARIDGRTGADDKSDKFFLIPDRVYQKRMRDNVYYPFVIDNPDEFEPWDGPDRESKAAIAIVGQTDQLRAQFDELREARII